MDTLEKGFWRSNVDFYFGLTYRYFSAVCRIVQEPGSYNFIAVYRLTHLAPSDILI